MNKIHADSLQSIDTAIFVKSGHSVGSSKAATLAKTGWSIQPYPLKCRIGAKLILSTGAEGMPGVISRPAGN